MMFKWILSAVNRFSLTEWTKPNVVLHTRSPRYIYGDGGSFLSLHWLLTVIDCSNWINITKSSCSLVSSLRLNTVSSNSSNVGCFTQPLIVTQQHNVGYDWSTSLCPYVWKTTILLFHFTIFKDAVRTYHMNKFYVTELVLCWTLNLFNKLFYWPKKMTQISFYCLYLVGTLVEINIFHDKQER